MIITKEQQEAMVRNYRKEHSTDECIWYLKGLYTAVDTIQEKLREEHSADERIGYLNGFNVALELVERSYKDTNKT